MDDKWRDAVGARSNLILGRQRIHVSTGFVTLLAVLFYLDREIGLLMPGLAACVFHELGHIVAVYCTGGSVKRINLTVVGAELVLDPRKQLSYGRELLVAMAGPLSSFLSAWISAELEMYLLAGMSLGQGCFNLLPVLPLDGGRALHALLCGWGKEEWGDRIMDVVSAVLNGILLGLGGILLRRFGNPTLIITVCWLVFGVSRKNIEKRFTKTKKCLQYRR